jgi:DNA-binding response OmpR family regulator
MRVKSRAGTVAILGEPDAENAVERALQLLGAQYDRYTELAPRFSASGVPRCLLFDSLDNPDIAIRQLRQLRKQPHMQQVPALLVVAERQVARVPPEHGFDEFLVKPFFSSDLYTRIKHMEWRSARLRDTRPLVAGGLQLDRLARTVKLHGTRIRLTAREFELICYLAAHPGEVQSRQVLLAKVWGASYLGGAKTVDIHIRRLRVKLGLGSALRTAHGHGYALEVEQSEGTGL